MIIGICKVTLRIVISILLLFIALVIDSFLPVFKGYLSFTSAYVIMMYFMTKFCLFLISEKYDKKSLYMWLDNLAGSDDLLKTLFLQEKNSDILNNLEQVFNKFNVLTQFDIKKMKLLRGYFKALNNDGPQDLMNKTILGIIVAIVIGVISKGALWGISTFSGNIGNLDVNPIYITILNYLTYIIEILLFLTIFIKDYFKSKLRNKIILEILEVCIEENG